MNKTDKMMTSLVILFSASIVSITLMRSPMHHLGMGFVWLVFIVAVVLIVSREASDPKRRKR